MKLAPVLIANRGEIAIRVARTARRLGFPTVALYSDADRESEHVGFCDYAIALGGVAPRESYLDVEKVINAARTSGARYVHPGYGFLSERAAFVRACTAANLEFLGPSAEVMDTMGDKIRARETVDRLGVPRVPGSPGAVATAAEATKIAEKIGFPVLLKAAAGGGGKGMRRVDEAPELASAFEGAAREALGAFGDGSLYVEKYILEPHHVEIQVFGDGKGGAVHLGERECSIQRRHQKVWEEAPAPILDGFPETRRKMFEAAVTITRGVRYAGAGTLEFIVDGRGDFYFLEMNTRLQVEHPVTEWVRGVDLVEWQLRLAADPAWQLPPQASLEAAHGSAIEVRLYAEDPVTFLPSPGKLGDVAFPSGPFVRVDSAFSRAGEVSIHYDPMIAKISVWGATRAQAVSRVRQALDETRVERPIDAQGRWVGSLRTNLEFLKRLAVHPRVIKGDTTTGLIAESPELTQAGGAVDEEGVVVASLLEQLRRAGALFQSVNDAGPDVPSVSHWQLQARRENLR